ncbi:MAG: hypothetical protein AAGB34_01465 [Planctomycetota bacterium]
MKLFNASQPTRRRFGEVHCEQCGYPLEGIHRAAACPECGFAIEESHPEHRIGTNFQRRLDPVAWLQTALISLLRPSRVWRVARIDARLSAAFGLATIAVAAGVYACTFGTSGRLGSSFWVVSWTISFAVTVAALVLLTLIEAGGLRFFGRRKGFPVSGAHAITMTSLATGGWLVGAMISGIGWRVAQTMPATALIEAGPNTPAFIRDNFPPSAYYAETWILVLGWLIGFALFEIWSYRAFLALKYANLPLDAPLHTKVSVEKVADL